MLTESTVSYAQKHLLELIEKKQLKKWCMENNIPYTSTFRAATGERPATYSFISTVTHLIAPIEWLFTVGEKLPYEPKFCPPWDHTKQSAFVKAHRNDYKNLIEKYDLEPLNAYNIFVRYVSNPSLPLIRQLCAETDPINFFIGKGEKPESEQWFPERGDIVRISGKTVLVLGRNKISAPSSFVTGIAISEQGDIRLSGTKTEGFLSPFNISSFKTGGVVQCAFVESVTKDFVTEILSQTKKIFS